MKFLVDAQLPVRLARFLQSAGYDTIHTKDLPQQNATTDTDINAISIQQNRIVVTKDRDFCDSFMLRQEPYKLLLITTGNIKNNELEALFLNHIPQLFTLFNQHSFIEISRDVIIVHQ
jgi:predicted nuclease of predicted toxin-antitoxin system